MRKPNTFVLHDIKQFLCHHIGLNDNSNDIRITYELKKMQKLSIVTSTQ